MIKVFCCFYNEAALIPFFLRHYHFVHAIQAFVSRSLDATRELLAEDPRVTIVDREMPDGIDDDLKASWLNEAIGQPDPVHAWHVVVDADELIWPPNDPSGQSAQAYLDSVPGTDVSLLAHLTQVYRHETDQDLDVAAAPVVLQRRHGVPLGAKPAVLRANHGLVLTTGNHGFRSGHTWSGTHAFEGAHWQNADPSFAVTRRIRDRRERISAVNRKRGYGRHHWAPTVVDVERELALHRHDAARF